MKKLLLAAMLALLFVCLAPMTALAAEEGMPAALAAEDTAAGTTEEDGEATPGYGYARITEDGVYLYRTASASAGLFVLPRSYFVKITGEAGDYLAVEYLSATAGRTAVRGYVLAEEVTAVDYIPETPYLYYSVDVTFSAGEAAGLPSGFITEYTVSAPFYGTFSFGSSTYYYVELNGTFGYVPASACTALDYPLNTEHTEVPAPEEPDEQPTAQAGLSTASIVLICLLVAAALAALILIFRPLAGKKRAAPEEEAGEFYQ